MDTLNICMVDMYVYSDRLHSYECKEDCQFGVQFEHLAKVVRCMRKKSSLEIGFKEIEDEIELIFRTFDGTKISTFTLHLMDITSFSDHQIF